MLYEIFAAVILSTIILEWQVGNYIFKLLLVSLDGIWILLLC